MPHGPVGHSDHGRVRVITLNRPPSNALNREFLSAIDDQVADAESAPEVGAIVIASALPKYFSSGLDLEALFSAPERERLSLFEAMIATHRRISRAAKPTVAAMEGYALLGGYIVGLGCDFRFMAADTGRVALSEVRLGISPTLPLIRIVSSLTGRPGLIKDLILRGQTLRGDDALAAGLIDHLMPKEGFLNSVIKEAEKLSKLPRQAYSAIKRDLRSIQIPNEEAAWKEGLAELQRLFTSPEGREGMLAMKEKRKPRWE